ncbi:MAG: M20 family metallopeptidase [Candidatus Izemoplasmatales bacterium]
MFQMKDVLPYKEELIQHRRYLHQHPELGFDVANTHDYIQHQLSQWGIQVLPHVGKNSLLGIIENGVGPIIGLRADIDALPILEENTELDYCSLVPGKMHACGHDAHTAMLLMTAKFLVDHRDSWKGTVKLIFQEAEEGPNPGGAYGVVNSHLVDDVETFYAFHVAPMYPSGSVAIKKGEAMASADTIKITLQGRGAHAAYPHLSIDPIVMAAEVIMGAQTIVSRRKNPLDLAVLTIAQVHAGTTHNIIPSTAYLEGTVRTFSNSLRKEIDQALQALLDGVAKKSGGSYSYEYIYEYDPTINTPSVCNDIEEVVTQTLGKEQFHEIKLPSMGAEDFGKYSALKQGAIMWLGIAKDENTSQSLHHPRFQMDENALPTGVLIFANLVCRQGKEFKR